MNFLILDIGAGTMDVLYYNSNTGNQYKAVAESPVLSLTEKARSLPGDLLITGKEMGGGAISKVLKERTQKYEVIMSASSAATIHHDRERVRSFGIQVVEDAEAEELKGNRKYSHLNIGDLEMDRIRSLIKGMGVPFSFDVVALCAQDHGMPPPGMSHLDYRHQIFKALLDRHPFPHAALYRDDEIPPTMSRLTSLGESAGDLKAGEVFVMDSGMAAVLGASLDPRAREREVIITLDLATSHTVGAALIRGEMAGFFEYHTSDITLGKLESLLIGLAEGKLDHDKILEEGGHGAYIRKVPGYQAVEIILATGPKRSLIAGSKLPITDGAPLGDNMMTGTAGVLEAIRIRKDLDPFN